MILCLAVTTAAQAQAAYPVQNVTLVTHSSPGGGSDVFLRALAKHLGPKMGVNFAVENVSGGSGARAMARVAQAPADGSVLYATTPTYIQTTLLSKPPHGYDEPDAGGQCVLRPRGALHARRVAAQDLAEAMSACEGQPRQGPLGRVEPGLARAHRHGATQPHHRRRAPPSSATRAAATR